MAKLNRKLQKIFASSAQATELTAFGTEKTGSPVDSSDVEVLQTAAYETGWSSAIKNDKAPYMSEMNGVQYGLSYQLKYLFQNGMAEWLATEAYYIGSFCREGSKLYVSKADNNLNHQPSLDATNTYWDEFKTGSSSYHPTIFSHQWSDHLINDIQWLRSDTFSWQSGSVYVTAYNELVSEYNNASSTTETEGSITFKRTPKGYKIADATQETAILNKYNSDGIAWYYILDTTNTQFKLPRCKYKYWKNFSNNTLPVKGNGISVGLTNGTDNLYGLAEGTTPSGLAGTVPAYGASVSGSPTYSTSQAYGYLGITTDSSKSGIVVDTTNTIEETGFYLYFYVGEYAQSAIEQTAGLNAELFNGKVDLNASNLNAQGKSLISGLGMPSSRYVDLTLGASGSTYTAPANGWFLANAHVNSAGQQNELENITSSISMISPPSTNSFAYNNAVFVPALKNDVVRYRYTQHLIDQTSLFRFIYAEGEPSS